MGQNNDVAWSFTNVMADVMDLFIERIDGDTYEFEGEQPPADDDRGGDRRQGAVRAGAARRPRDPSTGPIVNEALRRRRRGAAGAAVRGARRPRGSPRPTVAVSTSKAARSWSRRSAEHAHPVSNLVWADRHGSIGYKTVGRLPAATGRLPGPAQAGLDRRVRVGWLGPVRGAARGARPGSRLRRHGQQPDRARGLSRTTSRATISTATGPGGSRSCSRPSPSTIWRASRRCRPTCCPFPGWRRRGRLARLRPRDQRELSAIERLRSWDGRMCPDSIAATIYQAFTLRLGREVTRAAIGDRDLSERWLDRADNGFVAHVTSPWRWQSHLLALWDGGRRGARRSALGRARPRRATRRAGRPRVEVRVSTRTDGVGAGPPAGLRARPRRSSPLLAAASSTAGSRSAAARRPSRRSAGTPTTRSRRSGRPAGGWSPTRLRPERSRWQAFTGQSGQPASPHYDDLQAGLGRRAAPSRWRARARGGCSSCCPTPPARSGAA